MFWTRFVELCNEAGKSPNRVAAELGFSSSACTVWKKGAVPRDTAIQKMADYFHVTADYLLGSVNEPFLFKDEKGMLDIDVYALTETEKPTPVSGDGLDEEQAELVRLFKSASPALRAAALAVLRSAEEQSKVQGGASEGE